MHFLVYGLAALLFAVLAPSAVATPFGPAEDRAWAGAEAFWGVQPTLCTSITKELVPPGALGQEDGHDLDGRATIPTTEAVPCWVGIEEDAILGDLCSLMRHEYGHLLGFGHADPELAAMLTCDLDDAHLFPARNAWRVWRLRRDECRGAQDSFRKYCWRQVGRAAARIRAGDYNSPIMEPLAEGIAHRAAPIDHPAARA